MIDLQQEYDNYKAQFKGQTKESIIKELDLLEIELEDLIENRSKHEKGSIEYSNTFIFTILSVTTAIFWKIADIFNEKWVAVIVLIYLAIALLIIGNDIKKYNKEVDKIKEDFSEEREKIKELKMKIKILEDLIK